MFYISRFKYLFYVTRTQPACKGRASVPLLMYTCIKFESEPCQALESLREL